MLAVFRLDFGQIRFNLVENAFATWQLAVLASSFAFKVLLWQKSHLSRLSDFKTKTCSLHKDKNAVYCFQISLRSREIQVLKICKLAKWWHHTLDSAWAYAEIKILRYLNFFLLSFFSFSFLFAAVNNLLLGNFYDGAARCSGRKFCSEFLTQLFEHFCAYLGLHSANHPDLGIIRKMFPSCRSWV